MASENVLDWIQKNNNLIQGPVLEVGSKQYHEKHSFLHLRQLVQKKGFSYTGCDLSEGTNVDVALDLTAPFDSFHSRLPFPSFKTVFCISVLEHIPQVFQAAQNIARLVERGGTLFVSVPFVFRFHGYPGDYWRFTPESLPILFPDFDFSRSFPQAALSTLKPGEMKAIPEEFKLRNKFFFRPKEGFAKRLRKLLKKLSPGSFQEYSLAPTMVNMVGIKR